MPNAPSASGLARGSVVAGRYAIHFGGVPCGEERWRIEGVANGHVATGEQETVAPHPFPSRQEYRVTLDADWRPTGLEILWTVGDHALRAVHSASGDVWRVRIEYGGQVKEQEGDYPPFCEVDYGTHLFSAFVLARRDFALGGEHEFPALRVGPPYMAVTPDRQRYRCVERGTFDTPYGAVKAKRYEVVSEQRPDEGFTFWADEEGFVLASYEGLETATPWMTLMSVERG